MDPKEANEVRNLLNREADKLKDLLTNLLLESSWKEEVNSMCQKVIEEKGVGNVSTDDIVKAVSPSARAKVPAELKQLLMEKVRTAFMKKLEERDGENSEGQP